MMSRIEQVGCASFQQFHRLHTGTRQIDLQAFAFENPPQCFQNFQIIINSNYVWHYSLPFLTGKRTRNRVPSPSDTFHRHLTLNSLDDLITNMQTQSRALADRFGGKKGFKNL